MGRKKKVEARVNLLLEAYHADVCCDHTPIQADPKAIDLSNYEKLIKQIVQDLADGKIKKEELSVGMIKETYKDLREGVSKGWGQDFNTLDGDKVQQDKTVVKLHQNLYRFSGAKTATQTYEINKLLYTEDGQIRPRAEFMSLVLQLNSRYNKNYLETEYNTAVKAAAMARQWEDFQQDAELFPNLKYKTVGGDRVRPEHDKLNGTIKPLNDDFWSKYYPPNGWNCRCYVVQTAENKTEGVEDDTVPVEFYGNVGKDQVIFSKGQTYFQVARELGEEEFARHFERAKLEAPYLTVKGVKVNIWTDLEDYKENLDIAVIVKKAGYDIKLRPHVDSSVLVNTSNPEYLINNKLAERKAPKGLNLRNILSKANKQGCGIVVVDMVDNPNSLEAMIQEVTKRLADSQRFPLLEEILIVKNGEVRSMKRKKQPK